MTSPPRILLVDDIDANLIALQAQLDKLPCEMLCAHSGNEALRLLLKHEFAVMLLDVQMPEMDGYEVATYARENPSTQHIPIIFVTAMNETEQNIQRGYGAGAVDFLFKPINPYVLRSKVAIFLDLYVNRKQLADEIDSHQKTLAELEAFNYSVSHDLRAPLRPLDGFSQALLEDYGDQLDGQAKSYLNRIRAAAQRMSALIDDLLKLSRTSRIEMSLRSVDLATIAASIIAELRQTDPDRKVEYQGIQEANVFGDEQLLRIGLENLLRNAWKFSNKRPVAVIEFGTQPGDNPTYFVRDNGTGFDPKYAQKLFQPFQRLHSSDEYDGTGIGLSIVHRIIRRHNGELWAESSPDQGATFYFTLPRA